MRRRLRFLDDCIILFVHANPDGNDLVADWYMRNPRTRPSARCQGFRASTRSTSATTTIETSSHQRSRRRRTSTASSITSGFRRSSTTITRADRRAPWSGHLRSATRTTTISTRSLILGLQALGTHMHQRLATEGKPGATMASGGAYDGWWNGGIRNTGNFHNIIAILTETIGSPTPMRIPFRPERQLPNRDHPYPIAPQEWKFRQSVDYSMSFNRVRHRLRVAQSGASAVQHLQDGPALDSARQRGHVDAVPLAGQGRNDLGGPPQAGAARSARVHHSRRSAGLSNRHQVHQRAPRSERRRAASHGGVQRRRKEISGGVVRRFHGAGVSSARAGHVRAAGSPERNSISRRAPDSAVRQRGVDACIPDGRPVRPDSRAIHRTVRKGGRMERQAAAGTRRHPGGCDRVHTEPGDQRRLPRREPPAGTR